MNNITNSTLIKSGFLLNQTGHNINANCNLHQTAVHFGLVFIAVFMSIGMAGNGIVVVVLIRAIRNFKLDAAPATIIYVINLAMSDFFTCSTVMPFDIIYWYKFPRWPLTPSVCKLWNALFYTFHTSTSLGIVAISLDTYRTIAMPFGNHQGLGNCANTKFVICFIWLWSIAVGVAVFVFQVEPPSGMYLFQINFIAHGFYLLLHFIIPQAVAACCYIRLFQIAKRHAENIRNASSSIESVDSTDSKPRRSLKLGLSEKVRLARALLLVTAGYFLFWNPFLTVQVIYTFKKSLRLDWCSLETADTVVCWLAYLQCCVNPFIYALRKNYFKELLKRGVKPT
eukprot:gene20027-21990_t